MAAPGWLATRTPSARPWSTRSPATATEVLPTFFVLGAARCGTTSLHYWLAQHPDIAMSAIKEPTHFLFRPSPDGPVPCIGDDRRLLAKSVPDRTAYERLFPAGGVAAAGDASPLYLYTCET